MIFKSILPIRNSCGALVLASVAVCIIGCVTSTTGPAVGEMVRIKVPVLMERYRVPGVAVALIVDGRLVSEMAFGYANLDSKTRVRPDTLFQAASLGKPLFAYAVVQRAAAGEIDLEVDVSAYLANSLVPDASSITVAHLLSHTSGLIYSEEERRRLLTATPGSTWRYSGLGYLILQQALQDMYGEPLDALVAPITGPLQMRETSYSPAAEDSELVGYDREGHELPPISWKTANAASSLRTSTIEYARFVERVFADLAARAETPTTGQLMLRPRIDVDVPRGLAWGLGWGLARQGNESFFLHWGSNPGFKSLVLASVDRQRAMVVLTNSDNGLELATDLAEDVFGQKYDFLDFYMLHPDD